MYFPQTCLTGLALRTLPVLAMASNSTHQILNLGQACLCRRNHRPREYDRARR
jgi:hypothetical protein